MQRFWGIIIVLLGLAGGVSAQELPGTLSVTGNGVVSVAPDTATVTLGVQTFERTAGEALAANSKAMAGVMSALDSLGVERKDVQTTQLSLYPQYEAQSGTPRVSGYQASNVVMVRVRALADLGGILDQLARAGANNIQSISFDVDDPASATDEARRRAVADARARAELYAEAAGATLGALQSLTEGYASGPQPMQMGRAQMEAAMDVPVSEGTMAISAQVNLIYRITD